MLRDQAIGQPLRDLIDQITSTGADLRTMVDAEVAAKIDEVISAAANRVCRIAVIGQMKAGKSSVINCLVRRPDLLPTDVNPWTAVVTRLHFGLPAGMTSGMIFRFFTHEEWRDLAEGGGQLGELIDRLMPAFKRDELVRQMAIMRQQAEQRLGERFHHLLGKGHRFTSVSREVLERYVCAGEENSEQLHAGSVSGRFADITKSADLFFEIEPFACPATIIDTPGTNDPFLVRDQITHQQLSQADIYIVVLNAQQALSTTDLALLRSLHGLHKERIVVFVNRVDSLADIVADRSRIEDAILDRLSREFPGVSMPVICGSARWGELALNVNEADLRGVLTPSLASYARHIGASSLGEVEFWRRNQHQPWHRVQDVLGRCSGIAALSAAVSDLIFSGVGQLALSRTIGDLTAIAQRAESATVNELRILTAMGQAAQGDRTASRQQLDRLQADVDRIASLSQKLNAIGHGLAQDQTAMTSAGLERLRALLTDVVATFAAAEVKDLEKTPLIQLTQTVWRCDTRPLRQALEHHFLSRYRKIVGELLAAQASAADDLRDLLSAAMLGYGITLGEVSPHLIDPSPSIAALGQVVALDLGSPWAQWWRFWQASEVRSEKLRSLILAEFEPVAESLVNSARQELEHHVEETRNRFRTAIRGTLSALRQRHTRLAATYKSLLVDRHDGSMETMLDNHEKRLSTVRVQLAHYQSIRRKLGDVGHSLYDRRTRSSNGKSTTPPPRPQSI